MTLTPIQAPLCPLCGKPNQCAVPAAGTFDVECWCKSVQFSDALLAAVPSALQGKACICRQCAEGARDQPTAPTTTR